MAATSTNVFRGDVGAAYVSIDKLSFDASYTTGGYTVPGTIGMTSIFGLHQKATNTAGIGYLIVYNSQTSKIQVLWTGGATAAALAEITAGTNLSTVTATVLSIGY